MQRAASPEWDVLVVGGGPAGSTAAALLRERGWHVAVLEKDRHPRFHIGESLLPRNMPIFRRLGLVDELSRIGVVKRGADFSLETGGERVLIDFSEALQPDEPIAFQVKRAEFDEMLLRHAAACGAEVREGMRVTAHTFPPEGGVRLTALDIDGREHQFRGRFLIDASGRDTFLSSRLGLKRRNRRHSSAAVFSHFEGVPRRPGDEAGNISIYWFPHGWFWMIPLHDGRMSVGMVCWPKFLKRRAGSLEDVFWHGVALSQPVAERMKGARAAVPLTATGNFSYAAARIFGERFLLVGDAYAFIDPVFSSGVYLAMQGAEFAAEAVDGCLKEPAKARRHLLAYERRVRRGLGRFSWFIYRFTSPAMRLLFMRPATAPRLRAAVTSVLAGDVYGRVSLWKQIGLFKLLYAAACISTWRQSAAYRRRLSDEA